MNENNCLGRQSDWIINLKDKQRETIGRKAWGFEVYTIQNVAQDMLDVTVNELTKT